MKSNRFTSEAFLAILICVLLLPACKHSGSNTAVKESTSFNMYSANVQDSFSISVQLPLEYGQHPKQHYPIVVLTDANFFYPMLAPVLHQYEQGGLLPPLILVGVGYKSFQMMDSLRMRDELYPQAISSDEIQNTGGGQRFYNFITKELLPRIKSEYRTSTHNTLLGHSFGGYFSMYALLSQVNQHGNSFTGFVSASPSLWYNNYYLFQLTQKLKASHLTDTLHISLSVGALENTQWSVKPVNDFSQQLITAAIPEVKITTTVYTNLDHMDTGLISFIKGLEAIYPIKP